MTRRVVIVVLNPVTWSPPGRELASWRAALAEDVVDLVSSVALADPAVAATETDRALAGTVVWPGTRVYALETATVTAALRAAAADGYDQAAVLPADAPDLPAMLIGKLLQPLTTRVAAVAPATGGGLLGVASRLPVPEWFPEVDLDVAEPADVRSAAPRRALVAETPGWHRLRGPADLARLDPGLEGWETTRTLLS